MPITSLLGTRRPPERHLGSPQHPSFPLLKTPRAIQRDSSRKENQYREGRFWAEMLLVASLVTSRLAKEQGVERDRKPLGTRTARGFRRNGVCCEVFIGIADGFEVESTRGGCRPTQDTSSLSRPQGKSYGEEEEEGNPGTAVPARTPAAAVLLLGVRAAGRGHLGTASWLSAGARRDSHPPTALTTHSPERSCSLPALLVRHLCSASSSCPWASASLPQRGQQLGDPGTCCGKAHPLLRG